MVPLSPWPIALLSLLLFPIATLAQLNASIAPLPLEVRTPYMNYGVSAPQNWNITTLEVVGAIDAQSFFNGFPGRTALIRIDGTTYAMFGDLPDANSTVLRGIQVTPTRTVFSFKVGPMNVDATFLSPIEPGDFVKQSTPFSYLYFDVVSNDGSPHDVQIFVGVDVDTFLGTPEGNNITWTTSAVNQSFIYAVQLGSQGLYETNSKDQAQWGTFYFVTPATSNTTFVTESPSLAIDLFSAQGFLQHPPSFKFIGVVPANSSVLFALSRDLGSITSTQSPVVFSTGYIQDPAIQYIDLHGNKQNRSLYYRTNYSDDVSLIDDFMTDFPNALIRALAFETKIAADAAFLPAGYMDLVSLSARFVYASTVITVGGTGSSGSLNTSDVKAFLKNTGEATGTRVSAVETLYAAWPMFMYIDPSLGKLLLEPLLAFQNTTGFVLPYAAMDLGGQYPSATEDANFHSQGVEQTANMLIMTYAYARSSGDGSLISQYYGLLVSWAEYLVQETLYTQGQVSADGLTIANQTNLAFKGIVAIQAMADMSVAAGKSSDATAFGQIAQEYTSAWNASALASDGHLLASYGAESSWSLGYNYFADLWLETTILNQDTINSQIAFLSSMRITATLGTEDVGIPLDIHRPENVTSSWDMFAASYAFTNKDLQDAIIAGLHGHAGFNQLFIDEDSVSATLQSVALGAVFAPLALRIPARGILTNVTISPSSHSSGHHTSSGTRVAEALGGLAAAAVLAAAVLAALREVRKRRRRAGAQTRFGAYALPLEPRATPALVHSGSMYDSAEGSKRRWKNLEDYDYHDI
ncbi:hypothetical protein BC834DRAFT_870195 [Gloeopeniophorella convolvens]|nr:hypothetical protein BC834DRAFT_870195 [Gloeopeniophorella convolvens]